MLLGHQTMFFMGMEVSARRSRRHGRAFRDQLAADQIFRRGIDRLHRRHRAVAQMEDGEFALRRIAAQHEIVARPRQAGDLQLEIILVRPEPRHFAVGLRLAHHRQRRMLGLVDGVLHAFQPDDDRLRGRRWRVQSPAAKIAGSPVAQFWSTTMPSAQARPAASRQSRHWASRRCRPARCRRR